MLVSVVASTSVTRALAAPAGTVPVAARGDSRCPPVPLPTGPVVPRPSTCPVADRNATVTAALLCDVPPSQADRSYRIADPLRRSETDWRNRAVPPAPPANNCPPGTSGHRPVAGGKRGVPYRTAVGRPLTTCQPGIVTLSQPRADTAPVCAPGFSSRFVPGRAAAWPARPWLPAFPPVVPPPGVPPPGVPLVVPTRGGVASLAGAAGLAEAGPAGSAASAASVAMPLSSAAALVVTERPESPVIAATSRSAGHFLSPRAPSSCLIVQSKLPLGHGLGQGLRVNEACAPSY